MSKFEGVHRVGGHVSIPHGHDIDELFVSAHDVFTRTTRATDVVLGGMADGASAVGQRELQHPDQLFNDALIAAKNGVTGKVMGLAFRACPPIAAVAGICALGSFANDSIKKVGHVGPDLQKTWQKSYAENDVHKLHLYKSAVSKKYGHMALELGIGATSAAIGFGSGMKTGNFLATRVDGLKKSPEVLREVSTHLPAPRKFSFPGEDEIRAFKALYVDKVLKQKPVGSKIKVDEYGTKRIYHPDKSYEGHYVDGSKFHHSKNGINQHQHPNGEVTREIPGVMRISDKHNGDRVYKYHSDGLVETHKPSGTVIREHHNGVVETHRTDGTVYREHPNGTTDLIKKRQARIRRPSVPTETS